jgi:hypothetical protein
MVVVRLILGNMPVTFSEHAYDPDDPDGPFRRLAGGGAGTPAAVVDAESPWVEPDYSTIPDDAHLPADEDERYLVWPGPQMVMPGNMLPDGSAPTRNLIENAYRIQHIRYTRDDDADSIIWAYWRQQNELRARLGLPRPRREFRDGKAQVVDTPETFKRIRELHAAERRRRAAGH